MKIDICNLNEGFHIFTQVKINGYACRFLIDTGASMTIIDERFYLSKFGDENTFTQKSYVMDFSRKKRQDILFANVIIAIERKSTAIIELPLLNLLTVKRMHWHTKRNPICGVLGTDLLTLLRANINFKKMSITTLK